MAKKLSLLIAAVAVLAFAVPSVASAAEATYPAGTRATVGQELQGTGKNITLKTASLGNIICESLTLNAKITVNNGTTVTASGKNVNPTQAGCYNVSKERLVNVTSVEVTDLNASEPNGSSGTTKNGTVSFTATVDLPSEIMCTFTGTNVPGTYLSTASPAVITSTDTGGHITSTGGCGNATLSGSFTLHGPAGSSSPVVLH